jgi:hypothetical protein
MEPNPFDALQIIQTAGTIGLLVLIVVALLRGWVVTKATFELELHRTDLMRAERDEWRDLALTNLGFTERALTLTDKVAKAKGAT